MNFSPKTLTLITGLLACLAAQAADGDALLQANGCLSCHAKHEKVVGPAFQSIAEKYKDDKDAVAGLMQSIQNGSKGKWGRVPMPPHSSISQDDLKALARLVLATKG
jgi:cytochrome c